MYFLFLRIFYFFFLNNTENLIERNDCFIEPFLLSVPPLIFVNIARANIESKVFCHERENGGALQTSNLIGLSELDVYNGIED